MKILAILILGVFIVACKEKAESVTPTVQDITESVYASGKVKCENQHELFSLVNGRISAIHVKVGDKVQKGDPLITLVSESAELDLDNARIQAKFRSVKTNSFRLEEAKQNIELANANLAFDSAMLAKQKYLWANGIGTRNDLENRELKLKDARTAVNRAHHALEQTRHELRLAELQSINSLEINNVKTKDFIIRANSAGMVYELNKKCGESVTTQAPVITLGDDSAFFVELKVDELDIGKLLQGQPVLLTLDSYKSELFTGNIRLIHPFLNEQLNSVIVEADFQSRPPLLMPNLSVEANVVVSTKKNALTVPRNYVIDDRFVVLADGHKREIETGLKDYDRVEIIGGLSKNEKIYKPVP